MMQPPLFWQNSPDKPGLMALMLSPVAALWRRLSRRRMRAGPWHKAPVPVICVGNINIGGTGKTPSVIALAERLKNMGLVPHVVSRGYGGSLEGPVRVDIRAHSAADVGDEPLLIAGFCDAWVARDRHAGAVAAARAGADLVLLDDGFQNPSLRKDISIIVVDAVAGFGNGRVFPAGPLRESAPEGLARADILLVIGSAAAQRRFLAAQKIPPDLPVVTGALKPLETGIDWKGQKLLAFAGIGHPAKFFATLKSLGADIVQTEALADHQPLTLRLMQRLEASAFFKGAQMVTTEKDAARLPEAYRLRVLTLPVRLDVADWGAIDRALAGLGLTSGNP